MGAVTELRGARANRGAIGALCGACMAALVLASLPALAQSASAPLRSSPVPADDGLGERGALLPVSSFTPLRLSLSQGLFRVGSTLPGCASREDASGNSVNGFPIERYS